ncbi:hypothetical protein DL98DRAFT_441123, partial [Cadophora sp. DSE1049]
ATDTIKDIAKAAAKQLVLDIIAKVFYRITVLILLVPLELIKDLILIFNWIAEATEIITTLVLITFYIKEIEKSSKAEFKVFSKK